MAAGDFYIIRNSGDTSVVPNAGSNLDVSWDSVVKDTGSIVTLTNPNLQVDIGIYLIIYSEKFYTADVTSNERISIQGEIHVSGTGAVGGYGSDYIRKASDQQECVVSGYLILEVTSDNTDIFIRFYREDNSTSGTVNRVPNWGGVQILELDDTDNYGLYSSSSSEQTAGTTEQTLNTNTNDRQDTGFSNSSGVVTVSSAGRYLMTYSLDLSNGGIGRETIYGAITRNGTGTIVPGSRAYAYSRGSDNTIQMALTWIGIVDVSASDTFQVRWSCPTSATITAASGAKFQMWQLPSGNETAIMEATTGDYNTTADFQWDTLPYIDTGGFTATSGNTNIDVNDQSMIMAFSTFSQLVDSSVQRAYPVARHTQNDNIVNYAAGGGYHRNSSTFTFAISVASIIIDIAPNSAIKTYTIADAESGSLANISGQFSILNLSSIWTYAFSPAISSVSVDNKLTLNETNVPIVGASFESVQGTGKVEFGDLSDYASATKVTQTIQSWNETGITFDVVQGTLNEGVLYIFVTNDNGDKNIIGFQINYGQISYEIEILNISPDHYWIMDNTYDDETGYLSVGARPMTNELGPGGGADFSAIPITRNTSYSWHITGVTQMRGCADSTNMNVAVHTERTFCGWIKLGSLQKPMATIYKEGGGVINLAFITGFGNSIMAQFADTADDNVQAFSNFNLAIDRIYHICMRFSYDEVGTKEFRFYIDGVEQLISDGNPLLSTDLDSHSGDINFGRADANLEMGGSNISFNGPENCLYSNFASWSTALNKTTQIREVLFELGALADIIITGTTTTIQNTLDGLSGVEMDDSPLAIKIQSPTDSSNLDVILDNITFNEKVSIDIQWISDATLNLSLINGSSINESKISTPNGGTVNVIQIPKLTLTNVEDGTEIRIYSSGTTTEVAGIESLTGGTFVAYLFDDYVDVQVVSLDYVIQRFTNVYMSGGDVGLPMDQPIDRFVT